MGMKDENMTSPDPEAAEYRYDHHVLQSFWFVVVDDLVGGWAVATVDKPTSEIDPRRNEMVAYWCITRCVADHIVELHNLAVS